MYPEDPYRRGLPEYFFQPDPIRGPLIKAAEAKPRGIQYARLQRAYDDAFYDGCPTGTPEHVALPLALMSIEDLRISASMQMREGARDGEEAAAKAANSFAISAESRTEPILPARK